MNKLYLAVFTLLLFAGVAWGLCRVMDAIASVDLAPAATLIHDPVTLLPCKCCNCKECVCK